MNKLNTEEAIELLKKHNSEIEELNKILVNDKTDMFVVLMDDVFSKLTEKPENEMHLFYNKDNLLILCYKETDYASYSYISKDIKNLYFYNKSKIKKYFKTKFKSKKTCYLIFDYLEFKYIGSSNQYIEKTGKYYMLRKRNETCIIDKDENAITKNHLSIFTSKIEKNSIYITRDINENNKYIYNFYFNEKYVEINADFIEIINNNIIAKKDDIYNFINFDGIKISKDYINILKHYPDFLYCKTVDNKYELLNIDNIIILENYDKIEGINNELFLLESNKKFKLYNIKTGKYSSEFNNIKLTNTVYINQKNIPQYEIDNKYIILDDDFNKIIESEQSMFNFDQFLVVTINNKKGLFDLATKNMIIPVIYDNFRDDCPDYWLFKIFKLLTFCNNNNFGVINLNNEIVIDCKYKDIIFNIDNNIVKCVEHTDNIVEIALKF
jgi:hypothetical protein